MVGTTARPYLEKAVIYFLWIPRIFSLSYYESHKNTPVSLYFFRAMLHACSRETALRLQRSRPCVNKIPGKKIRCLFDLEFLYLSINTEYFRIRPVLNLDTLQVVLGIPIHNFLILSAYSNLTLLYSMRVRSFEY